MLLDDLTLRALIIHHRHLRSLSPPKLSLGPSPRDLLRAIQTVTIHLGEQCEVDL